MRGDALGGVGELKAATTRFMAEQGESCSAFFFLEHLKKLY